MQKILKILSVLGSFAVAAGPANSQAVGQDVFPTTWDTSHAGAALSLTNYTLSFDDEFNTLDDGCYNWAKIGTHKWYTIKDGQDNFATDRCANAATPSMKVSGGVLSITAAYVNGVWQSGTLMAVDPSSEGFQQTYGYFEARIKLPSSIPAGLDIWPAFWAQGRYTLPGTAYNYPEIDVLENWSAVGRGANRVTIHQWPSKPANLTSLAAHRLASFATNKTPFDGQWHTYGVKMTPTLWIIYTDGLESGRFPMITDMQKPIYPILDLSLFSAPTAAHTASYTMSVDYVRVYTCPRAGC
jgi:beta-glucanase (GH16 family)